MLATADDLSLSVFTDEQRRSNSYSHRSQGDLPKQDSGHKVRASKPVSLSDSADEIQVIEEHQTAIPIQPMLERKYSTRHLDLDIGSVHARKNGSSTLLERRKRDDFDLLGDHSESSDDDDSGNSRAARNQKARGRERHTKPLLHPKQAAPLDRYQRYSDNAAKKDAYEPLRGRHMARGRSTQGRHPMTDCYNRGLANHHTTSKLGRTSEHRPFRVSPSALPEFEHEAMVFDNFEDVSPVSSTSEKDHNGKDMFDAHLHFVRPAMPICANPGAFVALESVVSPSTGCSNESQRDCVDTNGFEDYRERNRLSHHRAVSDVYSPATARTLEARATRRRATVGSEAASRLPAFHRRPSDPST